MISPDARFEDLFRRYYNRVVSYLVYRGFSVDDARDLAQETFLRVYKSMQSYRGEAEWQFLKTTAENLGKNRYREESTQKRKGTRVAIADVPDPADPAVPADVAIERREETERLADAISALPPRLRECFLLREQGYSYEEMAAILRIPLNSVKSRLHDAKRRLRDEVGGADERHQ
jgi:RNA polymerase sigma-70 factor (ECF subfamily)